MPSLGSALLALAFFTAVFAAVVAILGRWNWWLPDWAARILRVEPSPLEPDDKPDSTPDPARQPA